MRVVLDTNIVLDCFVFDDPAARAIVAAIESGRLTALTRADCLDELARVLDYPKLARYATRPAALERYRALACSFSGPPAVRALPRCKDPDDQKFLELARDAKADYLVSKDKRVLELARRRSIRAPFAIVKVEGLLEALRVEAR